MEHLTIVIVVWAVLVGGWIVAVCVMGVLGVRRWRRDVRALAQAQERYERASAAARDERDRMMAEARGRYDALQEQRLKAARALFEAVLQPQQIDEYDTHGHITVRTPANHLYRVCRFGTPIILHNNEGGPYHAFCLVSSEDLPSLDLVVQNVLLLEADEEAFLRAAARAYPTMTF